MTTTDPLVLLAVAAPLALLVFALLEWLGPPEE